MKVEGLRAAIEAEVTAYALNHYRHGVSATFSKPTEVSLNCPFALSLSNWPVVGWKIHCVLHWRSPVPAKELLEWALAQPVDCCHIWRAGRGHWCPKSSGVIKFVNSQPRRVFNSETPRCIIMRMAMFNWFPRKRWRRASHLATTPRRPRSWWSWWKNQRQSTRLPSVKIIRFDRPQIFLWHTWSISSSFRRCLTQRSRRSDGSCQWRGRRLTGIKSQATALERS